jgi:TPR repeat protein
MNEIKIFEYEDLIDLDQNAESKIKALASEGDSDAMYVLGIAYYDGDLFPRNAIKAIEYLQLAAEHGHVKARHDLACFYYYGYGLPERHIDLKKSIELFQLNAKENYKPSLEFLGSITDDGEFLKSREQ